MSPQEFVKASGERYSIRCGLHSKRSYVLSCHRGIAAGNESHCRRRRCFRSTSRSHVISRFIMRLSATLTLGQHKPDIRLCTRPPLIRRYADRSDLSLIRTAQPRLSRSISRMFVNTASITGIYQVPSSPPPSLPSPPCDLFFALNNR
jgi:hypothetical protein